LLVGLAEVDGTFGDGAGVDGIAADEGAVVEGTVVEGTAAEGAAVEGVAAVVAAAVGVGRTGPPPPPHAVNVLTMPRPAVILRTWLKFDFNL
jgi:hypothetical protein